MLGYKVVVIQDKNWFNMVQGDSRVCIVGKSHGVRAAIILRNHCVRKRGWTTPVPCWSGLQTAKHIKGVRCFVVRGRTRWRDVAISATILKNASDIKEH